MKNLSVNKLKGKIFKSVIKFGHDYCATTSLHGFRYIVVSRTTVERVIWLTICGAALVFNMILMQHSWNNFSNNPTMTTVNASLPIWKLYFPGVTICNNNKVYKPQIHAIEKTLKDKGYNNSFNDKFFESLIKLIDPDKVHIDNETTADILHSIGYTVEKLMFQLMMPCKKLIRRCFWSGKQYDCDKIFKVVKSDQGFCCGFNYHFTFNKFGLKGDTTTNFNKATDHHNDSADLPGIKDILLTSGAGVDIGLALALNIESENYKSSIKPYVGAAVLIHNPKDYPDIGVQSAMAQPGYELSISVSGRSVKSGDDIRNMPRSKRMCLFDGEVVHRAITGENIKSNIYSYQTCLTVCVADQIQGSCQCHPFYLPRPGNMTMRFCYLTDVDCILSRREKSAIEKCLCLPQCNDQTYSIVSETVRITDPTFNSGINHGLNNSETSFVYVHFRDSTFIEFRRQILIGWDGLFANFGGIFGLCLGGSVISMVEFIYYFAIKIFEYRIYCKKKRKHLIMCLPPASGIFMSAPTNGISLENKHPPIEKNTLLLSNENSHRRRQIQFP